MKLFKCAGWGKLRYHKDRNPSWIALQVSLLDDWDHEQLSDSDRWHLAAIWLLAAKHDRPKDAGFEDGPELKYDPDWVRRRCNLHEAPNLDKLASLGYIVMYESVQDCTPGVQICPPSSSSSSCTSTATRSAPAAAVAAAASSKEARDQEHLAKWEAWRAGLVAQAPSLGVSEAIVGRYMAEVEAAVCEFYERRGGSFTPRRKADLARRMSKASPWAQLLSIEQYVDGHYGTKDERYLAAIAEKRVNVSEKELEAEQDKHRHNQKNRGLFADITGGK